MPDTTHLSPQSHSVHAIALISVEVGMDLWRLFGWQIGRIEWESGRGPDAVEFMRERFEELSLGAAALIRRPRMWVSGRLPSLPLGDCAMAIENGTRMPLLCLSEVEIGSPAWNENTPVDEHAAELGRAFAQTVDSRMPAIDGPGWIWRPDACESLLGRAQTLICPSTDPISAYENLERACLAELERRELLRLPAAPHGPAKQRI